MVIIRAKRIKSCLSEKVTQVKCPCKFVCVYIYFQQLKLEKVHKQQLRSYITHVIYMQQTYAHIRHQFLLKKLQCHGANRKKSSQFKFATMIFIYRLYRGKCCLLSLIKISFIKSYLWPRITTNLSLITSNESV